MKFQLEKASESYLVGVLLAIAGGYLDVYTYFLPNTLLLLLLLLYLYHLHLLHLS